VLAHRGNLSRDDAMAFRLSTEGAGAMILASVLGQLDGARACSGGLRLALAACLAAAEKVTVMARLKPHQR
jgi:hypothetical protein